MFIFFHVEWMLINVGKDEKKKKWNEVNIQDR